MKKMSEKQSCLLTAKLWEEIYHLVNELQYLTSMEINSIMMLKLRAMGNINLYPVMKNHCPCCEFSLFVPVVKQSNNIDCHKCPMQGWWTDDDRGNFDCENDGSPYWSFIDQNGVYVPEEALVIVKRSLEAAEWWQELQDMNKM